MNDKKRLIHLVVASALTTVGANFVLNFTSSINIKLNSTVDGPFGLLLMFIVPMIGFLVASVPSAAVLRIVNFPKGILVALLTAVEAYLLTYIAVAFMLTLVGLKIWILTVFLCALLACFIVDTILNRANKSVRHKVIMLVAMYAISVAFLAVLYVL